jgi:galacturan 1,4-alpha-galacturonidase
MFNNAILMLLFASVAAAIPTGNRTVVLNAPRKIGRRCTGEIQSLADVAAAEECTTIVVSIFPQFVTYSEKISILL